MLAGLLAASRIRPAPVAAAPPHEHGDPWASAIARLQSLAPLEGFPPARWNLVQHGCLSLFNSHAAAMRRLGWTVEDGFGIHPDTPGPAVHAYGLGVLLADSRVVEMTDTFARILLRSSVTQTFVRRPNAWAVPIWDAGQAPGGIGGASRSSNPFPDGIELLT